MCWKYDDDINEKYVKKLEDWDKQDKRYLHCEYLYAILMLWL